MLDSEYSVTLRGFYARHINNSFDQRLQGRIGVPYWLKNLEFLNKVERISWLDVSVRSNDTDDEGLLFVSLNDNDEFIATLEVLVTPQKFKELAELGDKSKINFNFGLLNEKWLSEENRFISRIVSVDISITVYSAVSPVIHLSSEKLLEKWVLCPESRLGRIGLELINSIENWYAQNPSERPYLLDFEVVGDLLSSLRYAANNDPNFAELMRKAPSEFSDVIKDFSPDRLERARRAYDTVWQHTNVNNLITSGKLQEGVHQEILSESLEEIAQRYISDQRLSSPLLEWLLLDALLFNEIVAYARSIPNIHALKPLKAIWNSLWQTSKFLVSEGLALALTVIAAEIIDASKGVGFWAVIATVTLIRWLHPTRNLKNQRQIELLKLLFDMAFIHERLKHYTQFNARLIRELLYDTEKRGALFSPWAYHVLDKRIAREG